MLSVAAFALVPLTGCTSGTSGNTSAPAATGSVVSASASDVAFAQSMIPHHQQAVEMADLALTPDAGASAQVQELARQIKDAQDPEIQQMSRWLRGWGAPTMMPGATDGTGMAGMDHSGHDMGGLTMSGMMTVEQMQELHRARGQEFDRRWLEMMVEHHAGAIAMAEQVQSSQDPQVAALAGAIISAQQQEIAVMEEMLSGGTP
jgi:uncharacterized protein (DUF305 family)